MQFQSFTFGENCNAPCSAVSLRQLNILYNLRCKLVNLYSLCIFFVVTVILLKWCDSSLGPFIAIKSSRKQVRVWAKVPITVSITLQVVWRKPHFISSNLYSPIVTWQTKHSKQTYTQDKDKYIEKSTHIVRKK